MSKISLLDDDVVQRLRSLFRRALSGDSCERQSAALLSSGAVVSPCADSVVSTLRKELTPFVARRALEHGRQMGYQASPVHFRLLRSLRKGHLDRDAKV